MDFKEGNISGDFLSRKDPLLVQAWKAAIMEELSDLMSPVASLVAVTAIKDAEDRESVSRLLNERLEDLKEGILFITKALGIDPDSVGVEIAHEDDGIAMGIGVKHTDGGGDIPMEVGLFFSIYRHFKSYVRQSLRTIKGGE